VKRKFRITRANDFKRVRRLGKVYTHPLAVVIASEGECKTTRVGIITGKTIGNAVTRNRIKRQLRAVIANLISNLKPTIDFLIIAREPIRNAPFCDIQAAIMQLLNRAELTNLDKK
jgi:ribonuclease P protein component